MPRAKGTLRGGRQEGGVAAVDCDIGVNVGGNVAIARADRGGFDLRWVQEERFLFRGRRRGRVAVALGVGRQVGDVFVVLVVTSLVAQLERHGLFAPVLHFRSCGLVHHHHGRK